MIGVSCTDAVIYAINLMCKHKLEAVAVFLDSGKGIRDIEYTTL